MFYFTLSPWVESPRGCNGLLLLVGVDLVGAPEESDSWPVVGGIALQEEAAYDGALCEVWVQRRGSC